MCSQKALTAPARSGLLAHLPREGRPGQEHRPEEARLPEQRRGLEEQAGGSFPGAQGV